MPGTPDEVFPPTDGAQFAHRWDVPDVKWLSKHWTDNRYVVAAFLALVVINALAMQAGYYR